MIEETESEREEELVREKTPHLSHSRINRYLLCPEQYRLHYVEKLRPRFPSASLVFGQVVHQALAPLFGEREDPVKAFTDLWDGAKDMDLAYRQRESWEKLRASGENLLRKFMDEEFHKISHVLGVEKAFELGITALDLPFVGIIDLVAEVNGKLTVVDFKTSASAYEDFEAALSDQLSAYQLAEPDAEQTALCVLMKTKEPRIEWFVEKRTAEQLLEFIAKAEYAAREIQAERFYKRPGKWCSWCDYLPVCLKNEAQIRYTLVRV